MNAEKVKPEKPKVVKREILWHGDAKYDPTEKYRYWLERVFICPDCNDQRTFWKCACATWKKKVVFIMLNPSTATAEVSDRTVKRCENYATDWKFRRLVVLNIFAIRSTDPAILYSDKAPIGPKNNRWIQNCTKDADLIICAWGQHGEHLGRGEAVRQMLRHKKLYYLKLGKNGIPTHPLYLDGNLKPKPLSN